MSRRSAPAAKKTTRSTSRTTRLTRIALTGKQDSRMTSFHREKSRRTTVNLHRDRIRGSIEPAMNDELWSTLLRFHREIAMPDVDRSVANGIEPLRNELVSFKRETHANFDAVWSR